MRLYTIEARYQPLLQRAIERAVAYARMDAASRQDPTLAACSPVLEHERDDQATGDLVILIGVANDDAQPLTLIADEPVRIQEVA